MSSKFYTTLKLQKQGTIHPGSRNRDRKDWFPLESVHCGIRAPWDLPPAAATGKRQHKEIIIRKEVDTATPLLFQWCATKEVFPSIVIEIVEVDGNGWERTTHTVILTNALITAIAPRGHQGKLTHDLTIDFDQATVTPGSPSPALPWVRSWQDIEGIDFGYP